MLNGAASERYFSNPINNGKVVDLDLQNLPEYIDVFQVKKLAGAKHIIQAEVKEDNLKGICKGEGRITFRLNNLEEENQIKDNLRSAGVSFREH